MGGSATPTTPETNRVSLADIYSLTTDDPGDIVAAGDIDPGELLAAWIDRPAWMADAACRGQDPEVFFLERGSRTDLARAICATCPVHAACLRYALDDPDLVGVWGGHPRSSSLLLSQITQISGCTTVSMSSFFLDFIGRRTSKGAS